MRGFLFIPHSGYTARMHELIAKFMGFAGTGAIATGIQYLILVGLRELGGISPVIASATGYGIAAVANYLMKYHWVFRSDEKHHVAGPKYAVVSASGLALNTLLMYLGTQVLGLYYLFAQVITTGLVLIWNFALNGLWTFRAIGPSRRPRTDID
jgi:putative flippase GtrA